MLYSSTCTKPPRLLHKKAIVDHNLNRYAAQSCWLAPCSPQRSLVPAASGCGCAEKTLALPKISQQELSELEQRQRTSFSQKAIFHFRDVLCAKGTTNTLMFLLRAVTTSAEENSCQVSHLLRVHSLNSSNMGSTTLGLCHVNSYIV